MFLLKNFRIQRTRVETLKIKIITLHSLINGYKKFKVTQIVILKNYRLKPTIQPNNQTLFYYAHRCA
jgi:hypothetical protein